MKKLVLHIGTEKTGTTTIQEFLYLNRQKLLERNIYFPNGFGEKNNRKLATVCMQKGHTDDHHRSMGLSNPEQIEQWNSKHTKSIIEELESVKQGLTIISSEHFSSRLLSKCEIENLKNILAPIFDEIEVVVYLRRQDKYAVSLYSTALKDGSTHKQILPENFFKGRYDYYHLCKQWEDIFGSVSIRIFDRGNFKNGDLICDFLSIISLTKEEEDFIEVPASNPSISEVAQSFLLSWNSLSPKYNDKGADPVHRKVVDLLEQQYSGKPRLPVRQHVIYWMEKYNKSNEALYEHYFSGQRIFSDDYQSYPEEAIQINDIQIKVISIAMQVQKQLNIL